MNLDLPGPQGILEAVLDDPRGPASGMAAVVCHPHPLFGGTLQNKVVYRIGRGLSAAGIAVLRFNFRGVGRSSGDHDEGVGEADDLRAAIAFLGDRLPGRGLLLSGYSFGAHVASVVFAEDRRALSFLGVGPAVRVASFGHLASCQKPKTFVVAGQDVFGSPEDFRPVFDRMAAPKEMRVIDGAQHSFDGKLDEVEQIVRDFAAVHGGPGLHRAP
ncbi:MAG: alpha/beta family hydrolase [Acidobacteriota bacterium]